MPADDGPVLVREQLLEALIGAAIFRAWVHVPRDAHPCAASACSCSGATFFAHLRLVVRGRRFRVLIGWKADPYWDVWRLRFFSNMLATQTIVPAVMATASMDWRAARKAPFARYVEAHGARRAHR